MTQQGMSTKSRHLTIPDLITIGVFTALYFVLVAVATLFSSVALMGFGMILLPAVRRIDLWLRIYAPGCQGRKIRRD